MTYEKLNDPKYLDLKRRIDIAMGQDFMPFPVYQSLRYQLFRTDVHIEGRKLSSVLMDLIAHHQTEIILAIIWSKEHHGPLYTMSGLLERGIKPDGNPDIQILRGNKFFKIEWEFLHQGFLRIVSEVNFEIR